MELHLSDGPDRPRARTDRLIAERVSEDLVIYDEAGQVAHSLTPELASVWHSCDGELSRAEIAARLGLTTSTVDRAVDELGEAGLLVMDRGYSRRDFGKRVAAVGGTAVAVPLLYSVAVPGAAAACSNPGCAPAIEANFNGTAVPAGDYIWFNAVINVPSQQCTINLKGSTITFPTGVSFPTINVPDTVITFGAAASITFNAALGKYGTWEIVSDGKGNIFLGGVAWPVPAGGLPGGNVNPQWNFPLFTCAGAGFNVQWAAAAYSTFSTNYNSLDVLVEDGNGLHAGTPQAFESDVVGGARGGGGSNYTGSYSGTVACMSGC